MTFVRLGDLLERDPELACASLSKRRLSSSGEVVAHDARRQRVVGAVRAGAAGSAGTPAGRARATPGGSNSWMRRSTRSTRLGVRPDVGEEGDLLDRQREVAVGVEVADDERAELLVGVGQVGQPELPDQVIGQERAA